MVLASGYELAEEASPRRCYVCRVEVLGELIRKDLEYGEGDGPTVSMDFHLSLCPGHEDMETWPWESRVGFYLVASDAMGVPSPFD